MGKHEKVEDVKLTDTLPCMKFLDLYADIKGFPQTQHDLSDTLLMKRGVLPAIEIADSANDNRTGKPATRNDFAEAGVSCKRSIEKDGAHTVTVDYGNGVVISSTEGGKPTDLGNGHKVTLTENMSVTILGDNVGKAHGIIEDAKGRVVAKRNDDGSYTVDTGTGSFFTQRADGTIRKETAIRTRRPHEKVARDFEVIDTETPLGNLRPSDMTHHSEPHGTEHVRHAEHARHENSAHHVAHKHHSHHAEHTDPNVHSHLKHLVDMNNPEQHKK